MAGQTQLAADADISACKFKGKQSFLRVQCSLQNGCELYVENGGGTDKEITCHADITTSAKRVR